MSDSTEQRTFDSDLRGKAMLQMHDLLLQALRHREQDILRFMAILGPALAGIIYLHSADIMLLRQPSPGSMHVWTKL